MKDQKKRSESEGEKYDAKKVKKILKSMLTIITLSDII